LTMEPKVCLKCCLAKLAGKPSKPCAKCLLLNVDPFARIREVASRPSPLAALSLAVPAFVDADFGPVGKPAWSSRRGGSA
jgi:hypothetical protein